MFNWRYVLIPLSIVMFRKVESDFGVETVLRFRELYVFGIRLAYWTVRPD